MIMYSCGGGGYGESGRGRSLSLLAAAGSEMDADLPLPLAPASCLVGLDIDKLCDVTNDMIFAVLTWVRRNYLT
jgi:hypothetical protein